MKIIDKDKKINTNIQLENPLEESKDKNGNKGILSIITNVLINTNQKYQQKN